MQRLPKIRFLSSAAPLAIPAALLVGVAPALADTTISTSTVNALNTAVAGNVTVSSGGAIKLPGGTAVTVDSSSNVNVNSGGSLTVAGVSNSAGIAANAGVTTTITNGGTIAVTEDYTPPVLGNSSVVNGPLSQLTNRYGIHVLPGAVTNATISNTGTITVEGNNSAGIAVDSDLAGSITNTGTINVKGDNSIGVKTGNVNGNLAIGGTVAVIGNGAQAVVVGGNVAGAVKIDGAMTQAVSYTADDGTTQTLSPTAISTGKAAVQVSGNVTGGVIVTVASTTNNVTETTGSIQSYGTSPALLVGGAGNTTIGPVVATSGTYSVAIDGSVSATAYYSGLNAFGVVVGGQGGTVNLANGVGVHGTVTATTVNGDATAIRNPEAYLFTVAGNLVKEHAQMRRRAPVSTEGLPEVLERLATPCQAGNDLDQDLRRQRLADLMGRLSPKCRAVMVMHYRDEMPYKDIGEALSISPNMVKKYIVKGLALCRQGMAGYD